MLLLRFLILGLAIAFPASVFAQAQPAQESQPPASSSSPLAEITRNLQDRLECFPDNHCRMTGRVEVEFGPMAKFFADEIDVYVDPTLRIVANGNVVFTNPEGRVAAERVEFNIGKGTGTFHMATGSMSLGEAANRAEFGNQDPDVYFYGETIEKVGERSYRITKGGFTTCVQPTPRWEVVSGSIVLNLNDYAIARNMLLRVKGVPLVYLPLIYYPIQDDDRATGFLLPTYGTSTLRGNSISNAFFWAIGRSHDATFFHDWFTRTGQGAGAEYRFIAGQQSAGNFRVYRFDQRERVFTEGGRAGVLPAGTTYQVMGAATQGLGRGLRAHERVDFISDLVTQQLYQQNTFQATNPTRTVEAGLSGVWSGLSASALYQRTETFSSIRSSSLYGSTPRVTAALAPQQLFGLPIYGSLNSEYAFLPYKSLTDGVVTSDRSLGRFDVLPSVRVPLSRLTFVTVNSSASYRVTRYSRTAGSAADNPLLRRYFTARSDIIGPVLTKIWDTPDSRISERMKHVIEPTFSVDYVTTIENYRQVPILSDNSDFVISGATRFTYGLNNRFFLRGRAVDGARGQTREFVTVSVQQTYYTKPESSRYDTTYAGASGRADRDLSPIALTARVAPVAGFDANARFEYDVSGGIGMQVFSTGARISSGDTSGSASYSRRRNSATSPTESYLTGSTNLSFLQNRVTGAYSLNWDLGRSYVVSQSVMMSYMAQCCGIQAEFQKFSFPPGSSLYPIAADQRFNVSFVLAGLGTFSNFFGAFGAGQ
jgi:LPS-assembly protein